MPATEPVDFEREFAAIVRELRALPTDASPELRGRVRALGEPAPRRWRRPVMSWRRATVVLVPACLAAVVAAAAVHGLLSSSAPKRQAASSGSVTAAERSPRKGDTVFGQFGPNVKSGDLHAGPVPNPSRHQDYQAELTVRVQDADALGQKSAAAMRIVQQLGGYVASVSQSSAAGQPGEADLVLRVPVAHVEDAMIRLSGLGTVLSQNVSIVDLENVVRQQRRRIQSLRLQIARITAALQQPGLTPDVKLRLQFQLDDARRNLADVTGQSRATLREAALSHISLALTTQKAAPARHHSGRFGSAVSSAFDFLAEAGAVALIALIV